VNKLFFIFFLIFLFSCNNEEKSHSAYLGPKVVEAKGYVVLKDSMRTPPVFEVDESKLTKIPVGKPKIVTTNLNVHKAVQGKVVMVDETKLRKITPGTDTFSLPKKVIAIDSPFTAGIPEIVIAKDMANKDQNPANFSSFGKLQGLKHGSIRCMLQDKSGNLWFGTYGGGVSRYNGASFTHFTEKEGLSNNVVYSMLEDKNGNLWFGTSGGGVSKYNGASFTHFTEKEGLSNNVVLSILEDKSGNLWFGTNGGGVSKYNGASFTHFTEKEGLSNNVVYSMLEDKSGNLWFGTLGGGVSKYNGTSFTHFTEKEGLSNNVVWSILEDKSGNLWFGTDGGGLSKCSGTSFTHFTEKEGLSNNVVLSILEDKSGNLWFGTNGGGLSKYNGASFTHFTEKEGLSNNDVLSILEDKSGNLWFGTNGGGISKYNGASFTHFTEKEGLNNNAIWSIVEDKSGNLWFGNSGGGVSKYNGASFTHFTEKEGLSNNVVLSILEDKSGNLWFGTSGGGVSKYNGASFTHFTEKEGLSNNVVYSMLEDKSGNLWFGTDGGGVSKYNGASFTHFTEKEGLSNNVVYSMLEDKSGNLWFGTNGGGVSKYNGTSFTHFTEKEGLSNNVVWSIVEDKSGNLWFGTSGGGVSKYNGASFTHFTEKEGLSNNYVFSILEDKSGNLWFETRFGLSMLSEAKFVEISEKIKSNTIKEEDVFFKTYSYEDGFLGIGCIRSSILEASNGTIWVGANDRLTAMHPESMEADSIPPSIRLSTIELFNENIVWANLKNKKDSILTLGNGVKVSDFEFDGITKWYTLPENLSLAYNNNYLTFNFIGITMAQPKKVRYQYILDGLDENWSAITNETSAPYGNLPHGSYTFKVKAMNSEGYWSKQFEYSFTIRPPWWKTWWFRTLVGIIVVGSIIFYIKWRERALKETQKQLELKVDEATAEIRQQKEVIEEKHKEITDSINYAERIQRSFLATQQHLNTNLNEYFVLFKPKDVVSGDFYWSATLNNGQFALATADSTGHGVPGAIMSLLNITSLEKAIETNTEPSDILNATRKIIIERLSKDGSAEGGKDGMDCSLCVYDFKNMKVLIAVAHNPVWIIRGEEVIEIKADKMPVGKHDRQDIPFSQHSIDLQKGDVIYTLTDGFPDQFGGEKGKKFMSKNVRELLVKNAHLPLQAQKALFEKTFADWVGNLEQVDDVTIVGIRV
jgi:two-component system sensor histidine kinase ChiS